jgi:RNA-directed DNA polymerase
MNPSLPDHSTPDRSTLDDDSPDPPIPPRSADYKILRPLATAFLAGEQSVDKIVARANRTLARAPLWLTPLAERYLLLPRPRTRDVVELFRADINLLRDLPHVSIAEWLSEPPLMTARWEGLPEIPTIGDLAGWLRLLPGDLDWFADLKGLGSRPHVHPPFAHYTYRLLTKTSGSIRLIEAPKTRLKRLQRRILTSILDRIPPHEAAHGFVRGRSIIGFAAPHTGRHILLRIDLQDFFPSFSGARIQAFFRTVGYPESVADLLGGICTNAAPRAIAPDWIYRRPHLPQGAPTSPALANACFWRSDCRLAGLARSANARYTRYADDLAFSGGEDFSRHAELFSIHAAAILAEEGFAVNHGKTRIMRQGVRQHLAGVVTNRRLNIARDDFDRLKATLHNCVRHGPAGQNRQSHPAFRENLAGRIAFVESVHPERGSRLRAIFEKIDWD